MNYPARFVAIKYAIRTKFVMKNPFPRNNINIARTLYESPSVVVNQSTIFLLHGSQPMRILKGCANCLRDRRNIGGGGNIGIFGVGTTDTILVASNHVMDRSGRKRRS